MTDQPPLDDTWHRLDLPVLREAVRRRENPRTSIAISEIGALEAIVANTDEDEVARFGAPKILDGLAGAGKHIGLAMATASATGQIPGAN